MSQTEKLYSVLSDGRPHRVDELLDRVYGAIEGFSVARLGARVWDLKKRYNVEIKSWPDHANRKMWVYQIIKDSGLEEKTKPSSLERRSEIAKNMVPFVRPETKKEADLFGFNFA